MSGGCKAFHRANRKKPGCNAQMGNKIHILRGEPAVEVVLDQPLPVTGGVWISREGHAPWRHGFISRDHPGIR